MKIFLIKDLAIKSERRFPENKQWMKHVIVRDYQRIYHYPIGFAGAYYFTELKEGQVH